MYEVNHYISASEKSFVDFAESLTSSTHQKFEVHNHKMVFPPTFGEGRLEFYEFDEGLSLFLCDLKLVTGLKLKREAIKSNDYYVLQFNLSTTPILTKEEEGKNIDIGSDWIDAVIFSSSGKYLETIFPPGVHLRAVFIIINRSWALNKLRQFPIPIKTSHVTEFLQGDPMIFTTNLDLKSLSVTEEILNTQMPAFASPLYLQGNAFKLIALFAKHIVDEDTKEERLKLNDVVRITSLKNEMEKDVTQFNLTIEAAAGKCLMSKTKFLYLFKAVYNKNYTDMVKELRMQRAAELLRQGNTVADSGHQIGYSNLGHFAAAFKEFFHSTPKQYQKSFK